MNEIFKLRKTSRAVYSNYKLNLVVPTINQVFFGDKILRYNGPKVWNSLLFYIKSSEYYKIWDCVSCKCKVCQYH